MSKLRQSTYKQRKALASRLKRAREAKGLLQQEVAKILEVSPSLICNIERGERRLDVIELARLAQLYDKPVSWFLDWLPKWSPPDEALDPDTNARTIPRDR